MAKSNRTVDRIQAVWNKLGGEESIDRLLSGQTAVVPSIIKVIGEHYYNLQGHDGVSVWPAQKFPIWKTVKLGTCKSPDEYRTALKKAGRRISDWGDDMLGRITCSQDEVDLNLVILSVGDLGFKGSTRYSDICAKTVELGLELCPAEVGPALRLQYGDQPRDEWLRIAMEAIAARDGRHSVFGLEHSNGVLWLYVKYCHPDSVWSADFRFVFVRRK